MNYLLFCISLVVSVAVAEESTPSTTIKWDDLNRSVRVVGAIGLPLGEVAKIEVLVVPGRETCKKALDGSYLLRVLKVNGRELSDGPLMEFKNRSLAHVPLAPNTFSLCELKRGERADSLTDAQIRELEKDYVGVRFILSAYEAGLFSGIPRNLPKDLFPWQDHAFLFTTHLVLLQDLSSKPKIQEKPNRVKADGIHP